MNPTSIEPLRFMNLKTCRAFLTTHGIEAMPICSGRHYIAVLFNDRGVFGVTSPETAVYLPEW